MPKRKLKEFFAVTATSVYHVKADDKDYGKASIIKIALNKESAFPVGHRLERGYLISVGSWLMPYVPEGGGGYSSYQRDIGSVNTHWWGQSTSRVVALFLKKEDAMACHQSKDLKPCDERWANETIKVLRAIGENHSEFVIAGGKDLELMPAERWKKK